MEVQNAVNQAVKEIATRFDFKGTAAEVRLEGKDKIVIAGDDEPKLRAVRDVLDSKLTKRGVSLKGIEEGPIEPAAKAHRPADPDAHLGPRFRAGEGHREVRPRAAGQGRRPRSRATSCGSAPRRRTTCRR